MDKRIKIIADDKIPFLKGVFEPLAEIEYLPADEIINEKVKYADVLLIRTRTKCDSSLLENTSIKFISTATIGYDHIDAAYCKSKNIKWINAAGCNSTSVMQYFAAALLTLSIKKKIKLSDKTIGIIGVGNVGKKIEKLSRLLGMNVLLNDPPRERREGGCNFTNLYDLIQKSDIITFHVPLNSAGVDKTHHLANEEFFSKINKSALIINTSRGEIIKSDVLIEKLKSEHISSCVLDVWENEPEISRELLKLVDIATPHIAGYSVEGKANGTAACVRNISEFFNLPINKNWYPSELPAPNISKEILINCAGKLEQEILYEAVNASYDVLKDHQLLIHAPAQFEQQRNNYYARREFSFFHIRLAGAEAVLKQKLKQLGFNVD
jgi:erythronate-4-phosphate dehydrogenase